MSTHLTKTQAQEHIERVLAAFHRTASQETIWAGWPGTITIAKAILEHLPVQWQPEPLRCGDRVSTGYFLGTVEFVEPGNEYAWVAIGKGNTQRYNTQDLKQL